MGFPEFNEYDYIGINGASEDQLLHPHFVKWQDWFINEYDGLKDRIAVFIPCAAIKPYYNSPIHKVINSILNKFFYRIHRIVISNVGVVPYEFCNLYPFNSYDWNPLAETDNIKLMYYEINKDRLINFLSVHKYTDYITYLRNDSISYKVVCDACDELNINLISIDIEYNYDLTGKDLDLSLIDKRNINKLNNLIKEIV